MTILCTIGYEKTSWPDVLASLQRAGITQIIDVRQLPLSRRAGFSKRQLSAGCAAAGIDYTHLRALGTPSEGREANRRRQWPQFWSIVDTSLATLEAGVALQQAAAMAQAAPSCLLCYEADPCICHRRRIAEMLAAAHSFKIQHLSATH